MSPQGLQAQATIKQIKGYDPKRDTKNKSLLKLLTKRASTYFQAGILPENERQMLQPEYSAALSHADAPA